MLLLKEKISLTELSEMGKNMHGGLVKAVVDIEQEIMVVDADMHADQEEFLLEKHDSQQINLWGINLHPKVGDIENPQFIEFDSMINVRPSAGNYSRSVTSPVLQKTIAAIVKKWVKP